MCAHWVIESKFEPPRVQRQQIERSAVVKRLNDAHLDAILVQAPAGFGKSTLLAQWAHALVSAGTPVGWLNLDEDDREPEQFVAYVAACVRRALGGRERHRPADIHSGLSPANELIALVAEAARAERRIALVLEDYHRAECEAVDALLRRLIELAPPWIRIAVSSRSTPKAGIARLKAEGRAAIVSERDLRFNAGEIGLFFDSALPAGAAEWTRFVERAEGWPVALQFARMWLADGGDVAALGLASETSDLGAYLSDQVFSALRPEAQDFLLRTSPLEDVSVDVAQALGIEGAERIARGLARSALPITLLAHDPLRFRYHHLLRDFLIARARGEGLDIEALHRRAARWFAGRGVLASAVRHALAGQDPEYAAALLDRAGGWRLIYSGQGQLRAILRSVHAALPDARAFPRLTLAAAILAAKSADLATARNLFRSIGDADAADDIRLIDALIRLYCDEPLEAASLDALAEVSRRLPAEDAIGTALTSNLLAYFTLQTGGYIAAKRYAVRAIAQFRQAKATFGEAHLYAHLGAAELALGNRAAAASAYGAMRDLCRSALGPDSDLEAIAGVLEAETSYQADDRARARDLLRDGLTRIEQADGWFDVFAAGYATAARLDDADHGPAAAFDALERGRHTARVRDMRRLERLLAEETVRTATKAGEIDRAFAECRRLGLSPIPTADLAEPISSLRGDGPALLMARLSLAAGDAGAAAGFLEIAEAQMQRLGAPFTRRVVAKLLTAAAQRERSFEAALDTAKVAVRLALSDQFLRVLFDEGPPLRELIDKAGARDALLKPAPAGVSLSARETQILGLLAAGLSNKEIARSIALDPNTVKYHLKRLFAKLAVERRGRAVLRARQYGLLP